MAQSKDTNGSVIRNEVKDSHEYSNNLSVDFVHKNCAFTLDASMM